MNDKKNGPKNRSDNLEKKERQAFFDLIRAFQESSGANDPDEVMAEVLEAQQAVRGDDEDAAIC